jgi:hypothetical protein
VGLELTDRRSRGAWNSTGGIDASFWLSSSVNVQAFAARTETSGPGGDDTAYRASVEYSGNRFGFSGEHLVIGPDVNAEMGFVTRTDIRRSNGNARITFRPGKAGVRKIEGTIIGGYITRLNGEIQDRNLGQFIETEWESGETLALMAFRGFTRLDEGFDMSDTIPVFPGDYTIREKGMMASTSRKRLVAFSAACGDSRSYGGRIRMLETGCTIAPNAHVSLQATMTFSKVRLPAGPFDSQVTSIRLVWALSTRLTCQSLIQYNSLEDKIILNARVHFIHHPGSDLFLVWNEERGSSLSIWDFGRRDAVMKLTYLVRL